MQSEITVLTLAMVMVLAIFLLCFIASGIKIVKEWDRVPVLRLGKFYGIKGPGIIWITPILDKIPMTVSLKIQQTKIDTGNYVSSDGSTRRLTGYVNWRIIHVEKVVLAVENYMQSIYNVVQHTVTKIAESFPGDTVLMDEETLYVEIQQKLEPILTEWGVKILEISLKPFSKYKDQFSDIG
jgi:regulator of protease activity HflC (stomatin/prohibitin superfamily)